MARIFISGSADGLGLLASKELIALGHQVVLHARNDERGREALEKAPGAEAVVTADLSQPGQTIDLAEKVNAMGHFDAVIHNAGVYIAPPSELLAVNTLAPYILTSLLHRPQRMIYLSSNMHMHGRVRMDDLQAVTIGATYSDTKLHMLMLCKAVARKWPAVYSNAVNPGWVPTKMGGRGAPDDLEKGYQTQVWLATSEDEKAKISGRYFFHGKEARSNPEADDVIRQEKLLSVCEGITGVSFSLKGPGIS